MFRKYFTAVLILGVVLPVFLSVESPLAQGRELSGAGEEIEVVALEEDLRRNEEKLDLTAGNLVEVGAELEEFQGRVDQARDRQRELGRQDRELNEALDAQKEAAARSRSRLEDQIQIAYKGEALAGVLMLAEGLFGGNDARGSVPATLQATRLLTESSRSIQHYKDAKQDLRDTMKQLDQSRAEYRSSGEESQVLVDGLEERESELRASVEALGLRGGRIEERIDRLEAKEEAGLLVRPPATRTVRGERTQDRDDGDPEEGEDRDREEVVAGEEAKDREAELEKEEARERELEIAREDIVTRPVEPIPYEEYVRLYKESAERYGFARDWYVLAAVGKIESNHGENMGPSSAGAMGPMQFLPSTWSSYGVDGDGDGIANIMDPKDAIPGAAAYLKAGGAPEDWYAALFTYNRAGWYVEEVLAIAESYRRIHGDDTVGPYLAPAPAAPASATSRPVPGLPRAEPPPPRQENAPEEAEEPPVREAPAPETESPPNETPPPAGGPDEQGETSTEAAIPAAGGETTTGQYQYQGR